MMVPEEQWDKGAFAEALADTIQQACTDDLLRMRYDGELLYSWSVVNAVLLSPQMQEIKKLLQSALWTGYWDDEPLKISSELEEWVRS